ncbi:MAG: type I 3-dehydroquinate dehydratase [Gammaproteobacteria bacterium]
MPFQFGPLKLCQGMPRIAASFGSAPALTQLQQFKSIGLDIAEWRLDSLTDSHQAQMQTDRREFMNLQLNRFASAQLATLVTIRTDSSPQDGTWKGTDAQYFDWLDTALDCPATDGIDLEDHWLTRAPQSTEALIAKAHQNRKTLVMSYHNFERTPDLDQLKEHVARAQDAGADLVKIVTTPKQWSDLDQLTELTICCRKQGLVTFAMGAMGAITRISLPAYGSLITFGYVDSNLSIPGQMHLSKLADRLKELY